ncbi:MAG TPA: hypothetical protein VFB58_18080 [Chloroflexota bacterium]|nr:hypothetical protein [Chloroflexota bacterium]
MTIVILIVVIIVILAIAFGVLQYTRRRKVEEVRDRFGPEYQRTVDQYGGDEQKAADVLAERRDRVEKVDVQPLTDEQRQSYSSQWQSIQAQFVDDPGAAVSGADVLISDVMKTMGYPTGQAGLREDAVSVQYPDVAENYRKAHALAQRQENGQATTEDLREAMLLYRSLFDQLVGGQ